MNAESVLKSFTIERRSASLEPLFGPPQQPTSYRETIEQAGLHGIDGYVVECDGWFEARIMLFGSNHSMAVGAALDYMVALNLLEIELRPLIAGLPILDPSESVKSRARVDHGYQ